jgi:hypothetical protein
MEILWGNVLQKISQDFQVYNKTQKKVPNFLFFWKKFLGFLSLFGIIVKEYPIQ